MKINSKWMTMAAVLTLSASLAVAAPGEGKRGKGGRHGRHGGEYGARFAEKLNLTDAQKAQVEQIRKSTREQNQAFFASSRETFKQFHEARKANDTARVESLKPTVQTLKAQMDELRQNEKAKIVAVLTPEQRAQFAAMEAERKERRSHRREGKRDRNRAPGTDRQ